MGESFSMGSSVVLAQGRNVWQLARADRLAFLVDAAAYYQAFADAVAQAERSVLVLGWDIDSRTSLWPDGMAGPVPGAPSELGLFLNYVATRRRHLEVRLLAWDSAFIFALERQLMPSVPLGLRAHRRIDFRLDDRHPYGAAHHQKIVVVDDRVAFIGGLDLTVRRWDAPAHLPGDPRRVDPSGAAYEPFHDLQAVLSGEAAALLGQLARDRWERATGVRLPACATSETPWPRGLTPDLTGVEVGIARTDPGERGEGVVREVEHLLIDAVRSAQRHIYIEYQYLTSERLADVLAASLAAPSGPEMVLIGPRRCSGWLEERTMGVLRARILRRLLRADRRGRLRVCYPHLGAGESCGVNVHDKLLIVDDRLLTLGSANLSNRSLTVDSECNLAIEAAGKGEVHRGIALLRRRLLAEHLGARLEEVERAEARHGSLLASIDSLRRDDRGLAPLRLEELEHADAPLPDADLVDPQAPLRPDRVVGRLLAPPARRRSLWRVGLVVLGLFLLALLLSRAPVREALDPQRLSDWLTPHRSGLLGPVLAVGSFVVGNLVLLPLTVLVLQVGAVFGPGLGAAYALLAAMTSAAAAYGVGRAVSSRLDGIGVGKVRARLEPFLRRHGLLAVIAMRLVPLAPFTVVNLAAGAAGISFSQYMLGSLVGMVPGILALTLLGGHLMSAVLSPRPEVLVPLGAAVVALVGGTYLLRRAVRSRLRARRGADEVAEELG